MKVTCPRCQSGGQVDESKIPNEGAHARCPKCQFRFPIRKQADNPEMPGNPSSDEQAREYLRQYLEANKKADVTVDGGEKVKRDHAGMLAHFFHAIVENRQKVVLFATAGVLILMILFPPFHVVFKGNDIGLGYHFFVDPPERYRFAKIDAVMLLVQCVAVAVIGLICWLAFGRQGAPITNGRSSVDSKHPEMGRAENTLDIQTINAEVLTEEEKAAFLESEEREPTKRPSIEWVKSTRVTEQDFTDFIGENADKYIPKFRNFEQGRSWITWHWPACLATFWWMLYRKLYLWAIFLIVLYALGILVHGLLSIPFPSGLVWMIVFGMFGHYIYYIHAKKKIREVKQITQDSDSSRLPSSLGRTGGVNRWAYTTAIIFSIVAILGMILAIAIPQWTSHRKATFSMHSNQERKDTGGLARQDECISGDCWNGKGVYISSEGSRYKGEWRDGQYHGHGVYFFPNGAKYEGEWKEGKYEGEGVFTKPNGARFKTNWRDGKPHGIGFVSYPDGRQTTVEYRNGNLVSETQPQTKSDTITTRADTMEMDKTETEPRQYAATKKVFPLYEDKKDRDKGSVKKTTVPASETVPEKEEKVVSKSEMVVKDTKTGLEWTTGPPLNISWRKAESWLRELDTRGSGWRLPTVEELYFLNKHRDLDQNNDLAPLFEEYVTYVWTGEKKYNLVATYYLHDDGNVSWVEPENNKARVFAVRVPMTE